MVLILKKKPKAPAVDPKSAALKFLQAQKTKPKVVWEPWNLWKHNVHASMLSTFAACPRQFELEFVGGWQKPQTTEALEFGNAFHYVLEQSFKLKQPPAEALVKKWVKEYEKKYRDEKRFGLKEEDLQTLLGWVEAIAPVYFQQWEHDFKHPWIGTEVAWRIPYEYPDGRVCYLAGKIDRIQQIESMPWAYDTKTKSTVTVADEMAVMPLNIQFNLYLLYLIHKYKKAGGFIQDIVRRPSLKQGKDNLPTFLKRCRKDIEARPQHYFMRPEYAVTTAEVMQWKTDFLDPCMAMLRAWQDGLQGMEKWWKGWPSLPRFTNPTALKQGMRKVDMFEPLTSGSFQGLKQGPWHGHPTTGA